MAVVDKQLAGELWYHGLLPREDIKACAFIISGFQICEVMPNSDDAQEQWGLLSEDHRACCREAACTRTVSYG
ncbi:hypothetical protein ANCDUO_13890 [Ancylostoma duodenale]|uniref:Uncharacterized protein n=1 Tax=Ancylostoma duodenale TaxID=51022 RepID=A0A0C2GAL9_9BILA|nr:hypothetical protein ANCDUO_13890 [Ancylostoma duodenale]